MKYNVGDTVRYDGGDGWFYGTVSAVFEHSICPCYRLSVDRMEKKSCKFSITQFEFELEAYNEVDSDKNMRKWENSEIEYLKKYGNILDHESIGRVLNRTSATIAEKWNLIKPSEEHKAKVNVEKHEKPEKSETLFVAQPAVNVVDTSTQKAKPKQKRRTSEEAWEAYFEAYCNGEKNNNIYTWAATNRKQYKAGKLSDQRFEKLMEVNFVFDVAKKKR
jgi:hypothetical protein